MKKIVAALAVFLMVAVQSSVEAQNGPFDHLKCYKVKDSVKFGATVSLHAFQDQFPDEQCRVIGKAKFFCVPVEKRVDALRDKNGPYDPIDFPAQDLNEDRICYKVKCPKSDIPPVEVTDQFGRRRVEKFVPQMLCTPAVKGSPPTTVTTTTTTVTVPDLCDLNTAGQCGGDCPNLNEVCVDNAGATPPCICIPVTPTPCLDSAPQCNGDCPQGEICQLFAGGNCDCVPDQQQCGQDPTTGQCQGGCPNSGEICQQFPNGCDCVRPCGIDPFTGQCGGFCPIGAMCRDDGAGGCLCQ